MCQREGVMSAGDSQPIRKKSEFKETDRIF